MMLLTLVNNENKPLLEIWYWAEREFLEYEKVKEYVKEITLFEENEEVEGRSSYLEKIIESPYVIKHSFVVKFCGRKGKRIEWNQANYIKVGEIWQISVTHNRNNLKIYLNGWLVGSIKSETFKEIPSRIYFQAVDKVLSCVSIFEGILSEDQFNQIYYSGESWIPHLESLSQLKNDKNIKLFCKFPCNLANADLLHSKISKILIHEEVGEETFPLKVKSCGKILHCSISKYTEGDFPAWDIPINTEKQKKCFIENPYQHKISNVITLREYLSTMKFFEIIIEILEQSTDIEKLNLICEIFAFLLVKNPQYLERIGEEVLNENLIQISRRFVKEGIVVEKFSVLLFQFLSNNYSVSNELFSSKFWIYPPHAKFLTIIMKIINIPKELITESQEKNLYYPCLNPLWEILQNPQNFNFFHSQWTIKSLFQLNILYLKNSWNQGNLNLHWEIQNLFSIFIKNLKENNEDLTEILMFTLWLNKIVENSERVTSTVIEIYKEICFWIWNSSDGKLEEKLWEFGIENLIWNAVDYQSWEIMDIIVKLIFVLFQNKPK